MTSPTKTCHCGAKFTEEQSSGDICFRCKVSTIGFTWRGPTRASRQNFHDHTIKSVIEDSVRAEKAAGTSSDMQPIGQRWV